MSEKGKKILKRIGIIALILIAVYVVLHFIVDMYTRDYYGANDTAYEYLTNTPENIKVTYTKDRIVFMPENPVAGIIFYQGALVEYTAYTPIMEKCAEEGIATVILHMSHNMAVLSPNAADGIQDEYPEITTWYMAGHSLGGAMADSYLSRHQEEYTGLILLASYPPKELDMTQLSVLSVYGTNDGVLNMDTYKKTIAENTPGATELVIDGGIHSYFGAYGPQQDDGVPEISWQEQTDMTVEAIVEFITE